jgi:hypothetical protein
MFYDSEVKIESLGEYIEEIIRLKVGAGDKEYFQWYRGHADISWELIPKVQRGYFENDEELFRKERFFTNDFQARASIINFPKPQLNEYANWLTLMQHYGLPTRLLDWSRSPLIALYFAVSDKNACERDACIWILTPGKLNEHEQLEKPTNKDGIICENSFIYNMSHKTILTMIHSAFRRWKFSHNTDAITPDDIKFDHRFNALSDKIAACYPTEADNRVYNQLSTFTVHNSSKKLVSFCDDSTLRRLTIPFQTKERLLYELSVCGITRSYIFPDFEHLAFEIQEWYNR